MVFRLVSLFSEELHGCSVESHKSVAITRKKKITSQAPLHFERSQARRSAFLWMEIHRAKICLIKNKLSMRQSSEMFSRLFFQLTSGREQMFFLSCVFICQTTRRRKNKVSTMAGEGKNFSSFNEPRCVSSCIREDEDVWLPWGKCRDLCKLAELWKT